MRRDVYDLAIEAQKYTEETLSLQAAASVIPTEVSRIGVQLSEITAEGYPASRYHSGTALIDKIENRAVASAKNTFKASYANVQPLSCSIANIAVMTSLLTPGDRILGLELSQGGHLTHGARVSLSGRIFKTNHYGLTNGLINMDEVEKIALSTRPKLIVAGASSYPRLIDYEKFRQIADSVGAILLADISHISGLVAGGQIPSPIDHAHVTTTSTYKQLFGPKGGLILSGKDAGTILARSSQTIAETLQAGMFPGLQGTPDFAQIAMKCIALENADSEPFIKLMHRVVTLSKVLATELTKLGFRVFTGGTDTHMVLLDLTENNVSGLAIEKALESVGIIANRNLVPNDIRPASKTSGIRLGTNIAAFRGLNKEDIKDIAQIIAEVIETTINKRPIKKSVAKRIRSICQHYPLRRVV